MQALALISAFMVNVIYQEILTGNELFCDKPGPTTCSELQIVKQRLADVEEKLRTSNELLMNELQMKIGELSRRIETLEDRQMDKKPTTCMPGWSQFENQCVFLSNHTATWMEAMNYCRTFNAKLAEPNTPELNTFLSNMAINRGGVGHPWLGGTDLFIEGRFVWATTHESVNPTFWAPGQPDNGGTDEHCLAYYGTFNRGMTNSAIILDFFSVSTRMSGSTRLTPSEATPSLILVQESHRHLSTSDTRTFRPSIYHIRRYHFQEWRGYLIVYPTKTAAAWSTFASLYELPAVNLSRNVVDTKTMTIAAHPTSTTT